VSHESRDASLVPSGQTPLQGKGAGESGDPGNRGIAADPVTPAYDRGMTALTYRVLAIA